MQKRIKSKSCKAALVGLFLALPFSGHTQERPNRFSLMTGFSNSLDDPFCIWGGEYQRQLQQHWSVGVQYSMWRLHTAGQGAWQKKHQPYIRLYPKLNSENIWRVGHVIWVSNYKFIDFSVYYQAQLFKRIKLTIGCGPSGAFGKNTTIDYYWINPEPPSDAVMTYKDVNASYFGLSQKTELTYSFLKNRLDAGLLLSGKYYFGLGHQIDLGFVLGVNF